MNNKDNTIRIGVMNNFNATKKEFNQIPGLTRGKLTFINSNIKTITKITAKNINSNPYKIVVTINPDIEYRPEYLKKLKLINKSKVGFVRLKYVPGYNHENLYRTLSNLGYYIVVTVMRFRKKETMNKYVLPEYRNQYKYVSPYQKLKPEFLPNFTYVCDSKGKGCSACRLCSKLIFNVNRDISSLNLSTSGPCKYDCPDCFAKACLKQSQGKIAYDKIKQNTKQKGNILKHHINNK